MSESLGTVGVVWAQLALDSSQYEAGMARAKMTAQTVASSLTATVGRLTGIGVGLYAVKRGIDAVVKSFVEFDTQMHYIWTLTDKTEAEMASLSNELRSLARQYNATSAEAARAMYQIYSAVFYGSDAMKILQASLKGAAAGLSDVLTAVDVTTTVLNAYRMSADKATYVNDVLFQTVKYGKTVYSELANQFGRLAGVSAPAGASLEDMAAAIATLTRQGIATDWAITSLRQTIMQILRPGEELRKIIEGLGYESGRALISDNGFAKSLGMINDAAEKSGVFLENLFSNVRAVTAVMPLASTAAGEYAKDQARIAESAGEMGRAFDKVKVSWEYMLKVITTSIKDSAISIGKVFMPAIKGALDIINLLMKGLGGLSEVLDSVGGSALLSAVTAIGTLTLVLAGLAKAVNVARLAIWDLIKAEGVMYTVGRALFKAPLAMGLNASVAKGALLAIPGLFALGAGLQGVLNYELLFDVKVSGVEKAKTAIEAALGPIIGGAILGKLFGLGAASGAIIGATMAAVGALTIHIIHEIKQGKATLAETTARAREIIVANINQLPLRLESTEESLFGPGPKEFGNLPEKLAALDEDFAKSGFAVTAMTQALREFYERVPADRITYLTHVWERALDPAQESAYGLAEALKELVPGFSLAGTAAESFAQKVVETYNAAQIGPKIKPENMGVDAIVEMFRQSAQEAAKALNLGDLDAAGVNKLTQFAVRNIEFFQEKLRRSGIDALTLTGNTIEELANKINTAALAMEAAQEGTAEQQVAALGAFVALGQAIGEITADIPGDARLQVISDIITTVGYMPEDILALLKSKIGMNEQEYADYLARLIAGKPSLPEALKTTAQQVGIAQIGFEALYKNLTDGNTTLIEAETLFKGLEDGLDTWTRNLELATAAGDPAAASIQKLVTWLESIVKYEAAVSEIEKSFAELSATFGKADKGSLVYGETLSSLASLYKEATDGQVVYQNLLPDLAKKYEGIAAAILALDPAMAGLVASLNISSIESSFRELAQTFASAAPGTLLYGETMEDLVALYVEILGKMEEYEGKNEDLYGQYGLLAQAVVLLDEQIPELAKSINKAGIEESFEALKKSMAASTPGTLFYADILDGLVDVYKECIAGMEKYKGKNDDLFDQYRSLAGQVLALDSAVEGLAAQIQSLVDKISGVNLSGLGEGLAGLLSSSLTDLQMALAGSATSAEGEAGTLGPVLNILSDLASGASTLESAMLNLQRIANSTSALVGSDLKNAARDTATQLAGLADVFGKTDKEIEDEAKAAAEKAKREAEEAAREAKKAAEDAADAMQQAFEDQFLKPTTEAMTSGDWMKAAETVKAFAVARGDFVAMAKSLSTANGKVVTEADVLDMIVGSQRDLLSGLDRQIEILQMAGEDASALEELKTSVTDLFDPLGALKRKLREIVGTTLAAPFTAGRELRNLLLGIIGKGTKIPSFQGLDETVTVASPGIINVHTGEQISPAHVSAGGEGYCTGDTCFLSIEEASISLGQSVEQLAQSCTSCAEKAATAAESIAQGGAEFSSGCTSCAKVASQTLVPSMEEAAAAVTVSVEAMKTDWDALLTTQIQDAMTGSEQWAKGMEAYKETVSYLEGLIEDFGELGIGTDELTETLVRFKAGFVGVEDDVIEGMVSIAQAFSRTTEFMEMYADDIQSILSMLPDGVGDLIDPLRKIIDSILSLDPEKLAETFDWLREAGENVGKAFSALVQDLRESEAWKAISAKAADVWERIKSGAKTVADFAARQIGVVAQAGGKVLQFVFGDLAEKLHLQEVGEYLKNALGNIGAAIGSFLSAGGLGVVQALLAFGVALSDFTQNILKDMGAIVGDLVSVAKDGIALLNQGAQMVADSFSKIVGVAQSLVSSFRSLISQTEVYSRLQASLNKIQSTVWNALLGFLWPIIGLFDKLTDSVDETIDSFNSLNVPTGYKVTRAEWKAATPGEPGELKTSGGAGVLPNWVTKLLEQFGDAIAAALKPFQDFIALLGRIWEKLGPAVLEGVLPALEKFGKNLLSLGEHIEKDLLPLLEEHLPGILTGALDFFFGTITAGATFFVDTLINIIPNLEKFALAMGGIGDQLPSIAEALAAGLNKPLNETIVAFTALAGRVSTELIPVLTERLPGIIEGVGDLILGYFEGLAEGAVNVFSGILPQISDFAGALGTIGDLLPAVMVSIADALTPVIQTALEGMTQFSGWLSETLMPDLIVFSDGFVEWYNNELGPFLKNEVFSLLGGIGEQFYGFLSSAVAFFTTDVWPFIKGNLWSAMKDGVQDVIDALKRIWSTIMDNWPAVEEWITTKLDQFFQGIVGKSDEFIALGLTEIQEYSKAIGVIWNSEALTFWQKATDIMAIGLKAMFGDVVTAFGNLSEALEPVLTPLLAILGGTLLVVIEAVAVGLNILAFVVNALLAPFRALANIITFIHNLFTKKENDWDYVDYGFGPSSAPTEPATTPTSTPAATAPATAPAITPPAVTAPVAATGSWSGAKYNYAPNWAANTVYDILGKLGIGSGLADLIAGGWKATGKSESEFVNMLAGLVLTGKFSRAGLKAALGAGTVGNVGGVATWSGFTVPGLRRGGQILSEGLVYAHPPEMFMPIAKTAPLHSGMGMGDKIEIHTTSILQVDGATLAKVINKETRLRNRLMTGSSNGRRWEAVGA